MNDELRALGNVRLRGILLLVAVAVAGGMAGGAIDRLLVARRGEPARGQRAKEERPVNREPNDEIPFSLRSVDLSAEQRARIVGIMRKYRPAAESVMRSVAPTVQRLNQRMNQEAICVLTPRQREDWIAWRRREGMNMEESSLMMGLAAANQCPK